MPGCMGNEDVIYWQTIQTLKNKQMHNLSIYLFILTIIIINIIRIQMILICGMLVLF